MRRTYLLMVVALVLLLGTVACAPVWGPGGGMMGGQGEGMMGGSQSSGMMGSGGMIGGNGSYSPNAKQITIDDAAQAVERYLSAYYGQALVLTEVMEFTWNFYAEVEEKATGTHAMELVIDKYSGQVSPEMGPNMMWNTRYGMMGGYYGGGSATAAMPVTEAKAKELAQQFLDVNLRGVTVDEADTFYGYYTLHTLKDGQIEGMLSVNGFTGAVWYHDWHGPFLDMKEFHEEP